MGTSEHFTPPWNEPTSEQQESEERRCMSLDHVAHLSSFLLTRRHSTRGRRVSPPLQVTFMQRGRDIDQGAHSRVLSLFAADGPELRVCTTCQEVRLLISAVVTTAFPRGENRIATAPASPATDSACVHVGDGQMSTHSFIVLCIETS